MDDNNRKEITSETKAWLLMTSFVAPIVCLGTHSGFVLIAWASDPNAAGSMTIVFVLSFFYYFFGFKQLYIVLVSRCQGAEDCELKCFSCKLYTIAEAGKELDEHHENLKQFNFKVLCCTLPIALVLIGAHGLSIAAYVLLPSSVLAVPSSLLNLLHWALIIGSGLIAYKLLTLHAPDEEIIAKNLLKAYDPNITSKDYPKELGQIFGKALKKYLSTAPTTPPPATSPTTPPTTTPPATSPTTPPATAPATAPATSPATPPPTSPTTPPATAPATSPTTPPTTSPTTPSQPTSSDNEPK